MCHVEAGFPWWTQSLSRRKNPRQTNRLWGRFKKLSWRWRGSLTKMGCCFVQVPSQEDTGREKHEAWSRNATEGRRPCSLEGASAMRSRLAAFFQAAREPPAPRHIETAAL